MNNPRVLYTLSALMLTVGMIALVDGYAEFASGEEGIVRWLMLPASQFILGTVLFVRTRKNTKSEEAANA
jgi:hypothetical protein